MRYLEIDFHGYHPSQIINTGLLAEIIKQAWEMGERRLTFIHGHGRNRGINPGFVNTNTGHFGLRVRDELRHNEALRVWIFHTTLDCSEWGSTSVKLKPNPSPSRETMDCWPAEVE